MKKLLMLPLVLLLAGATQADAQKFGYCNSIALMSQLAEVKQAESDLQGFQAQLNKKGQLMVKEFQDKYAELQRKKEQGTVAPKDYDEQMAKLQQEQNAIDDFAQKMQADLAKRREEAFKPILDKVNAAMKAVATEKGFVYVFDSSTQVILYADESLDVTELVKAKL